MSRRDFSFETLLAPVRPREFVDAYWEKRPLIVQRHMTSHYDGLFSLDDVDRYLLAGKSTRRQIALVPPPERMRPSSHHQIRDLSLDAVYQAFCDGETIRLESVQDGWPAIANLAAHVGGALCTGANVNAYITPAHAQGLSVHFDTHDVFIVQVDGSKEWWVYDADAQLPIEAPSYLKHLGASGEKVVDENPARLMHRVILEAGDMLYIPRGFPHKAATLDAPSVHLAVAIAPVYWVDLLKTAVERLAIERPELRRALTPGFLDDETVRQRINEELARLLRSCADTASASGALDQVVEDRIAGCRCPADGHFGELAMLGALGVGDLVERRAGMKCLVRDSAEGASIDFGLNQVRGPRTIAAVLEHVRDHERFRIDDLPGPLSTNSKLLLVRRLIREGLLRRVGPLLSNSQHNRLDDDRAAADPTTDERCGEQVGARLL